MRLFKNKNLLFVLILAAIFAASAALAAVDASLPLPGGKKVEAGADVYEYIRGLFQFGLASIGLVAFGSIIYGATRYMAAAGDPGAIKEAKERIYSALWGIGLALTSIVLLGTINPDLIRFLGTGKEFNVSTVVVPKSSAVCGEKFGSCSGSKQFCYLSTKGTGYECLTPEDYATKVNPYTCTDETNGSCPENQECVQNQWTGKYNCILPLN